MRDWTCRVQRLGGLLGYQEAADGVAGLCTQSEPVLDPFGIEFNCCRVFAWIVGSHNFREPAVAGTPLIDHHDAINRHLLLAISSQTASEHSAIPPYIHCIAERLTLQRCIRRVVS